MAGNALDRRDRAGAVIGVGVLAALGVVLVVGVPEDVGDRVMLPLVLAGLAVAVALSKRRARMLATAIGAGVVAGVTLGAALRLAMLIAALMGGGVERSLGGTVGLVLFPAFPATVLSLAVVLVRRLVAVSPPVGALLTAVLGGAMLLVPDEARAEMSARGALAVNVVTFVAGFAVFGYLLLVAQRRIETWWDARAARRDDRAAAEVAPA